MSQAISSEYCTATIRTQYYVSDTERLTIAVLGSIAQLGRWDPTHAARAESNNSYDWEVTVDLPLHTMIEWKWAVVQKATTATHRWETINNRELFLTNQKRIVLFASWDAPMSIIDAGLEEEPASGNTDPMGEAEKVSEDKSATSENIVTERNEGETTRVENVAGRTPKEKPEAEHEGYSDMMEASKRQGSGMSQSEDHERENVGDEEDEEEVTDGFWQTVSTGFKKWKPHLYKAGLVGGLAIAVIGGVCVLRRRFY